MVSSGFRRRVQASTARSSTSVTANAVHLANNDLEWRGERPRAGGLRVGSYRPILEVKCRSVGESGEICRGDCAQLHGAAPAPALAPGGVGICLVRTHSNRRTKARNQIRHAAF